MKAYIYAADVYCVPCGDKIKAKLDAANQRTANVEDELTYDSSAYPKGPYADGGGESDTPQHCAACGLFLAAPLTNEGVHYALSYLEDYTVRGDGTAAVLDEWATDLREYSLEGDQKATLNAYLDKRDAERSVSTAN